MTEHVLPYDHSIVPQETGYWCGPASTQVILNSRGIVVSEQDLAWQLGTTQDGTSSVANVEHALDARLPDGNYTTVWMPNDPPTADDRNRLWDNIVRSINAGYGVSVNIVAPPSNYPIGIKDSESPHYGGGTVFHYIAAMGYDDDQRAVWIADSGFRPFGYWIRFDQLATLIPPKGYAYANTASTASTPAPEAPVSTIFADVSEFQVPVDDSYPHPVLSIRVSDGTYQDHKFAQNYAWMKRALDSGRLTLGIIYTYVRPNWQANADTVRSMIDANGGLHPKVALMLDVESGGNPGGDGSAWINALYKNLADYAGSPARVFGYANAGDLNSMWLNRPTGLRVVGAGYGQNPNLPGQIAHQYTDGSAGGNQGLPMGAPPFGNCDMNIADNLNPQEFAAALGIGTEGDGDLNADQDRWLREVHDKLTAYPDVPEIAGKWRTRARYSAGQPVDDTVGMVLWTDANVYDLYVEFAASEGHNPSRQAIAQRATAHPDDERAVFFAKKYPAA